MQKKNTLGSLGYLTLSQVLGNYQTQDWELEKWSSICVSSCMLTNVGTEVEKTNRYESWKDPKSLWACGLEPQSGKDTWPLITRSWGSRNGKDIKISSTTLHAASNTAVIIFFVVTHAL